MNHNSKNNTFIYGVEGTDCIVPVRERGLRYFIFQIFFSIHAVVASVVTGVQIFSYDRNGQKLSLPGGFFSIGCMLTAIFGVIAPALN